MLILHAKSRYSVELPQLPCVLLQPVTWNDYFRWETLFWVFFYTAERREVPIGKIKILHRTKDVTPLPEKFDHLNEEFCSLGQSVEFYEQLLSLGHTDAVAILSALRDCAVDKDLATEWAKHEGFSKSLLRSAEAERAFGQAESLFTKAIPPVKTFEFKYSIQLDGFSSPHSIGFRFYSEPAELGRLSVLVGKNGTGKTALLAALARKVSGLTEHSGEIVPQQLPISRIIAVSFSAFDSFLRPSTSVAGVGYSYCGLRNSGGVIDMATAFSSLYQLIERLRESDRFDDWLSAVRESMVLSDETEVLSLLEAGDIESFCFEVERLSSGHKITLLTLTGILAVIRSRSLVLHDEPELHLHPNLLAGLVRVLHQILARFDSFAIVSSHSPIVVQEVPARSIQIIDRRDGAPVIRPYLRESFGDNLGDIVKYVFQTDEETRAYIQRLKSLIGNQGVKAFDSETASLSLRLLIRSIERQSAKSNATAPKIDDSAAT